MIPLNDEQRKFLEYIRDNHKCIGWNVCVPETLQEGYYSKHSMSAVIADWYLLCRNTTNQSVYGTPTKYLK